METGTTRSAQGRSREFGSSCVSGGWRDQQFDQRSQQRFAASSDIVNTLKEPEIERQSLLGNPPMGSEPRAKQGPKALHGVDMHLTKTIPVLVPGEFPRRMTHGVMGVAPFGQTPVDVIFIGVDYISFHNRSFDQGCV